MSGAPSSPAFVGGRLTDLVGDGPAHILRRLCRQKPWPGAQPIPIGCDLGAELVRKLESVLAKYLKNPQQLPPARPTCKPSKKDRAFNTYPRGQKLDAIEYYTSRIRDLEVEIKEVRASVDKRNTMPFGFASYSEKPEGVFHLHKIYVQPAQQGLGLGQRLIGAVEEAARQAGGRVLELNVNRHNPAQAFYERQGFQQHREENIPIGPYWMNDFVMRKEL